MIIRGKKGSFLSSLTNSVSPQKEKTNRRTEQRIFVLRRVPGRVETGFYVRFFKPTFTQKPDKLTKCKLFLILTQHWDLTRSSSSWGNPGIQPPATHKSLAITGCGQKTYAQGKIQSISIYWSFLIISPKHTQLQEALLTWKMYHLRSKQGKYMKALKFMPFSLVSPW